MNDRKQRWGFDCGLLLWKKRSEELRLWADGLRKLEVVTGASWDFAKSGRSARLKAFFLVLTAMVDDDQGFRGISGIFHHVLKIQELSAIHRMVGEWMMDPIKIPWLRHPGSSWSLVYLVRGGNRPNLTEGSLSAAMGCFVQGYLVDLRWHSSVGGVLDARPPFIEELASLNNLIQLNIEDLTERIGRLGLRSSWCGGRKETVAGAREEGSVKEQLVVGVGDEMRELWSSLAKNLESAMMLLASDVGGSAEIWAPSEEMFAGCGEGGSGFGRLDACGRGQHTHCTGEEGEVTFNNHLRVITLYTSM
ncbi:hypothetical protein M5K25_026447 [Dendrobium thyrsiflorum]|uniref:Uncharacterized protein n=1 Tax=Dendrobium thyrsiflorum TaxID=117978 RepID=A0ABD0TXA4_DENTH